MARSNSVRKEEVSGPSKGNENAPVYAEASSERYAGVFPLDPNFGKPEQIQKIKVPLLAALAFLAVVDFFVQREHTALIWDFIPGFSALFGLIAAGLIVILSKVLGYGLMKQENYYGGQHD